MSTIDACLASRNLTVSKCALKIQNHPALLLAVSLLVVGRANSADDHLPRIAISAASENGFVLSWPFSDRMFLVESTPEIGEPGEWKQVVGLPTAVDGFFEFTVLVDSSMRFYRLRSVDIPLNRPPQLAPIESQTIPLGSALALQIQGGDPDGDPLAFSARPLPLPANAQLHSGGAFIFRPDSSQVGVHTLTFAVSDGFMEDSQTITLTVLPPEPGTETAITGRVLDTTDAVGGSERPIPGVRISLLGVSAIRVNDGVVRRVDDGEGWWGS